MTEEILEILNKRRLITMDAAPIAKWTPTKSFAAERTLVSEARQMK